jgi:hypothetical protein
MLFVRSNWFFWGSLLFFSQGALAFDGMSIDHIMAKIHQHALSEKSSQPCIPGCLIQIPLGRLLNGSVSHKGNVDLYFAATNSTGVTQVVMRAHAQHYDLIHNLLFRYLGQPTVSGERMVLSRHVRRMDEWLRDGASVLLYQPISNSEIILHLGKD